MRILKDEPVIKMDFVLPDQIKLCSRFDAAGIFALKIFGGRNSHIAL